jgi:hypothetical protein
MAALGTFVAGAYTVSYNAVAAGISRAGWELEITIKQEMIEETDLYGLTLIDTIYRGANFAIQTELMEYKAGSITCFTNPATGTIGQILSAASPIARLGSGNAKALVLTAVASTPAAAAPATLTASLANLAPDYPVKLLFNSTLRKIPLRMIMLPSDSTGTLSAFTTT